MWKPPIRSLVRTPRGEAAYRRAWGAAPGEIPLNLRLDGLEAGWGTSLLIRCGYLLGGVMRWLMIRCPAVTTGYAIHLYTEVTAGDVGSAGVLLADDDTPWEYLTDE